MSHTLDRDIQMLRTAARRLPGVLAPPQISIAEAMAQLNVAGSGVLVLADESSRLFGVVSDGDIRRAILAGTPLTGACKGIATRDPVIARPGVGARTALRLMDNARGSFVNNLPVVDSRGIVRGLILRRDIVSEDAAPLSAVLMAGGFGRRLLPLTNDVPKPMLPVASRPLMEHTVARLQAAGISQVVVAVHHHANAITEHFRDGRSFGVSMHYVHEEEPLGTAGALRLVQAAGEPLLVVNGDILTTVNFREMLDYHREMNAAVTVGLRKAALEIPYGVVDCDGARVTGLREKPRLEFWFNAGIYIVEPSARAAIPPGTRYDMTDLIEKLVGSGTPVAAFPVLEYWLDIGRPADYEQAHADMGRAGHEQEGVA